MSEVFIKLPTFRVNPDMILLQHLLAYNLSFNLPTGGMFQSFFSFSSSLCSPGVGHGLGRLPTDLGGTFSASLDLLALTLKLTHSASEMAVPVWAPPPSAQPRKYYQEENWMAIGLISHSLSHQELKSCTYCCTVPASCVFHTSLNSIAACDSYSIQYLTFKVF